MKRAYLTTAIALALSTAVGCSPASNEQPSAAAENEIWPKLNLPVKQKPAMEQRIDELLAKMTLEQKVAQMIQPEIRDITVEDMRKYGFGSYLNGGGAVPTKATPKTRRSCMTMLPLSWKVYRAMLPKTFWMNVMS
ncbi:hypothetical protein AFK76_00175 [Idiomarina zobellii]|uniref:Beta-glucosidase n=1 Tax=Idiomarina zobellii TaxID=86103 RepID=A0A837NIT4_9GAMM|nr:hypothetical protein [Idiomarina zobellii]KPD24817.1 hypothetical protein AFK76_00175 [Idiomarina zobellii]SDF28178.1 beta-glucosidase [Idiomarina zobellii]